MNNTSHLKKQNAAFKVVVPKCLLTEQVDEKGVLNMINYLPAEEQQALLDYIDKKYQADIEHHNKTSTKRWQKASTPATSSPIRFLANIIENGVDADEVNQVLGPVKG